jgi:hypothetical protein
MCGLDSRHFGVTALIGSLGDALLSPPWPIGISSGAYHGALWGGPLGIGSCEVLAFGGMRGCGTANATGKISDLS